MTEMRIYIFINTSLGMGKGKMIAQAGHVVEKVIINSMTHTPTRFQEYYSSHTVGKIALKATQEEMEKIVSQYSNKFTDPIWCCPVNDMGRTQVPAGSLTALAFCPLKPDELPDFIKNAKLM